ncbi:MAG: efflux RND transporter permease subunit, partial [Dehalococcoidia bacterium]
MVTRLALRFRIITILLMVAVVAAGAYSLTQLRVDLLPDIEFPAVTVSVPYPDAPPQQVLEDITVPVEDALDGMSGMSTLQTISSPN